MDAHSLEIPREISNLKQKTALWDASSEAKFALPLAGLNYHSLDRACVEVEKRGYPNLFVQLLITFVLSASSITL